MKAILKVNDKEIEVEVSEEQLAKLTKKKSIFSRVEKNGLYCFINSCGRVENISDINSAADFERFLKANYCTDGDIIQQQAYRETLNRLLWRWQHENDEPVDWEGIFAKWFIGYDYDSEEFKPDYVNTNFKDLNVFFSTDGKAYQAIEEVIKPFMAEHPDFVW